MTKKYLRIFIVFLIVPFFIYAQNQPTTKASKRALKKQSKALSRKKRQRKADFDTLQNSLNQVNTSSSIAVDIKKDSIVNHALQKKPVNTQPKLDLSNVRVDSIYGGKYKDYGSLSELDSRWRQELFGSSLYDTIYKTIQNQNYSKIEHVANLPTEKLKEQLKHLNARTPFNVEYNPALESVVKNYLKNRHESLERLMALSDYYFPLFEEVLDKYDLPLEIKYLAIVESALKPRAKSRVGATGLWQFMFGTGREYDLHVSSYVDERMDPIKSTEASAQYLSKLYKLFGDWDLALAAYNSGPGNVTKAIRRSGGYTNYWNIRRYLPRETAGYLPAFLATMYIFEYADYHKFKPKRPEFKYFETDTVRVKHQVSLNQISDIMDIKIDALQFLNPSYKLGIVPQIENKDYVLRLPLEKVGVFVSNESAIYAKAKEDFDKIEKPLPKLFEAKSKIRYRIRGGDYLGLIARKFGVRVSQIKQWNRLRGNNIRVGKYLTIYPRKMNSHKPTIKKPTRKIASETYMVKSGDSLWSISQKFAGVSVDNLRKWNNISPSQLKPGMRLKLKK